MQLDAITAVVLTYDEAPNIGRTLEKLRFLPRVVVVDSFSTDGTPEIVRAFPNAELHQRAFDSHARQWNYAIDETGIRTPWILALDADYQVTDAARQEIERLVPRDEVAGYASRFVYCVFGKRLRGTAYPPVTTLFRAGRGRYVQDGHTQRVEVQGAVERLEEPLLHDDRKPLSRWLASQDRYMALEAAKLRAAPWTQLRPADAIRRTLVASPLLMLAYCLLVKGNILDGRAGLYYALQRMLAECLLSVRMLESRFEESR
jgi:glycosyltransferase involved in cell wall biosynthesis